MFGTDFEIASLDDAKKIARTFAENLLLRDGAVVLLCGEMGAGKTTLVSHILEAMGIGVRATSPTFTLINQYCDNIYHVDLWRINGNDVTSLGLDEILLGENLVFIEWSEKLPNSYWQQYDQVIKIKIEKIGPSKRKVYYEEI